MFGRMIASAMVVLALAGSALAAPVTSLTVQSVSSSQLNLSWPDAVGLIQNYYVYRNGVLITTLPGTQTTYQDSGLVPLSTYSYSVAAMSMAVSGATLGAVCSFNGMTITSGGSVTAYQSSSVPFGSSCISQSRICTNGALSGSYAFASCSVAPAPTATPAPVPSWQNTSFASQSGIFTAQFDAIPSLSTQDVVIGLSSAAAAKFDDLAAMIRFGVNGVIDVRNAAGYSSAVSVSNVAGRSYHVRMVVDVSLKRYSVYITPQGLSEILLAQNYAFRTSQAGVASLANRAKYADPGDVAISNFSISGQGPLACTFNGQSIASGSSVTAYQSSSVPAGQTCLSQSRLCTNGALSGSYSFSSCSVLSPTPSPTPTSGFNDGSANAPAGSAPKPTLLSGYLVRPAWKVAGVDYAIGVSAGKVLKDPMTISMPGVSLNTGTNVISVTGNNVTLDGYDFSLNGGWGISVQAANTKIINSKFAIGSANVTPIYSNASASNLYVGYCVIEGNGKQPGWGGLITMLGASLTVEYSWLRNAGSDIIQLHSGGGNVVIRYNLIEQAGLAAGAHGDYTQFLGGPFTATIVFNTTYQISGTTQGFMVEPDVGSSLGVIIEGEIGNNTMVSLAGMNMYVGITIADLVNTFRVHDNYFDPRGVFFFCTDPRGCDGDSSPKTIFTNNRNMLTGAVLAD